MAAFLLRKATSFSERMLWAAKASAESASLENLQKHAHRSCSETSALVLGRHVPAGLRIYWGTKTTSRRCGTAEQGGNQQQAHCRQRTGFGHAMLQRGVQIPAWHRGAEGGFGVSEEPPVCEEAVGGFVPYRGMGTTLREGLGLGQGRLLAPECLWKGCLLVDLQIKAEVIDEEVDGNELVVKELAFHQSHVLVLQGAAGDGVGV